MSLLLFFSLVREHLAFPSGEGGPLAVEEVLPRYVFAEGYQQNGNTCRNLSRPLRGHPLDYCAIATGNRLF